MSDYNIPLNEDEIAELMVSFSRAMSDDNEEEMRRIFMEFAIRLTVVTGQLDIAEANLSAIKSLAYPASPDARFQFDPVINRLMMGKRFEDAIVERAMGFVKASKGT